MPPAVDRARAESGRPPGRPVIPRQAHSLTLSSGAVFAVALAVQLIGLGGTIALYKHAGQIGMGVIGLAQLFLLIGSSINGIGDLRLGTAYTYFLARGKAATSNTSVYLALRLMMVGFAGIVVFGIAPLTIAGTRLAADRTTLTSLGLFLALPIAWSFSTVYNQMYVGEGDSVRAQFPSLIEGVARLPVLLYVAYYQQSLEWIAFAYVVGALVSMAYSTPAVVARLRKIDWAEGVRMFRFAWPLMGSLILGFLVTNMVPFLVQYGLGPDSLTVFLAANGFRVLVLSLPAAITTPLFPYLAGLHRQEEYEPVRKGTWQALRYSAMVLVPGVVALVTYRYAFLNVTANGAYAKDGALPLAILVVSAIPLALSQIIQTSINAIGRQRLELYITSTQVAVLVGSVLLLLPPWGLLRVSPGVVGGAVAVLVSSVAALALNTYFVEKLIRVHVQPWSIVRITLSAVGSFASLSLLNRSHLFPVVSSYQLVAAVLIGFVVYVLVLAGTGELAKGDVRRLGLSVGLPESWCAVLARLCWKVTPPDLPPIDLARAPGLRSTELPETFTGTTELPEIVQVPSESGPARPPGR